MLVLTRKKGQALLFGTEMRIKILDIEGDKVSIGIEAPENVVILREELVEQTIEYNKESLKSKDLILKRLSELNSIK